MHVRHLLSLALAMGLTATTIGCVKPVKTQAIIARYEVGATGGASFRGCAVHLSWTKEQLLERCGVPLKVLANAADPTQQCAVYSSSAHALAAADRSAPYIVACWRKASQHNRRADRALPDVIFAVYGLTEAPPG